MNDVIKKIGTYGIVPVLKIEKAENAAPLADALCSGGLPIAEITFRTSAAAEVIRLMAEAHPDMLIGAGTVLTTGQVDRATEAGARFIVSPGFNPTVVGYCLQKNIPIIPGCATCGEMEQAMELGLQVVKFFPAEASGGSAFLKAVSAPYPNLRFMVTGGVQADNISSYLSLPCVLACGGSFMVPAGALAEKQFDKIRSSVVSAVAAVHGFAIKHIGINEADEASCKKTAGALCRLLALDMTDYPGATFAGTLFEVLKKPFRGTNGHIGISCLNPDRAKAYLESIGFVFDETSAGYDEKGRLKVIYLKEEIGGFAIHLINR